LAELTTQEKLQPSLLDRLTDDNPSQLRESRDKRVIGMRQLRDYVIRDLQTLLNTHQLSATLDLDDYDQIKSSVMNYGAPGLTGFSVNNIDVFDLERQLKETIINFEPRILANTLDIIVTQTKDEMSHRSVVFQIEGHLWAIPVPLSLLLKTEIDLETGNVNIIESSL
jgi:type VI secretion system protein ImpF